MRENRQPELVIPYAALSWQPSEHFFLHLEYSQPGEGAMLPYGAGGWWSAPRPGLFERETAPSSSPLRSPRLSA